MISRCPWCHLRNWSSIFVLIVHIVSESSVDVVVCPNHESLSPGENSHFDLRSLSCVCRILVEIWNAYVLTLYHRILHDFFYTKRAFLYRSLKRSRRLFSFFTFWSKTKIFPLSLHWFYEISDRRYVSNLQNIDVSRHLMIFLWFKYIDKFSGTSRSERIYFLRESSSGLIVINQSVSYRDHDLLVIRNMFSIEGNGILKIFVT